MKPDAWIVCSSEGTIATTSKSEAELLSGEPLYSAETIRKWLEPSEEMVAAGVVALKADGWALDTEELTESMRFVCRAMIAVKLKELEDK